LNKNITYIYNALDVKLIKRVSTPRGQNETVYSNGFQYQDTKLQHFPTAEGYVSVVEGKINYVYNYTDHLGNIRLSYGLDPEEQGQLKILGENHYYPYGLKHSNYNAVEYACKETELGTYVVLEPTQRSDYRYKYNGMEFQDELGLNLYDMDFRDYDPAIARWTGIDPVTHHNMSPYMAFDGNPVFWADPSGLFATREAAMAHINQYGLNGATVGFYANKGWVVSNGGYDFFQSGNGSLWLSFSNNDGVFIYNLGSGGGNVGSAYSSSGGFGSSNVVG
jgi:RHS repeat-associated protein